MNYKKEETEVLLGKLGIDLRPDDKEKDGKALLKVSGVVFYFLERLVNSSVTRADMKRSESLLQRLLCSVRFRSNNCE